jgi:hypothetical protein
MQDRPDIDPAPVLRSVRLFLEWRGRATWPVAAPDHAEISNYLAEKSGELGEHYAAAELAYIQLGAPVLWGVAIAGMIGGILRRHRCDAKAPAKSIDDKARQAIALLPPEWQPKLIAKLSSEPGRPSEKWSAHHVQSVAYALARWRRTSIAFGRDPRPSGTSFFAYAADLKQDGVADQTVADYLGRILSGYRVAEEPGFQSAGCEYVIARFHASAKSAGRQTKTGAQIVGASAIYDLGTEIMDEARQRGPRGLHVARDFRNGLLLAFSAALPQRARAMSHFHFNTSVLLLEKPFVRVVLPGRVLKLRESKKRVETFDKVLNNPVLWSALLDYRRDFRPLFDDGSAVFPSMFDMGAAISAGQLGRLVGDLTQRHLGVRVSIHRVRDNVATEASEELQSGGYLAPALIGNRSAATTMRSYDHAQGMRAATEFGDVLSARRTAPTKLQL